MKFLFSLFHTSSPIRDKFSASLHYPSQPATGGILQEAVFGFEAYKCTSTDLVTMEDIPDASAGLQVEWMQTSSLGNVNAPSMHTCSSQLCHENNSIEKLFHKRTQSRT